MFLSARKNAVCSLVAVVALSAGAGPLNAEMQSKVSPRITQPVNDASVVTLRGNTHPLAKARYDQGAAPASMSASRMLLVLKRSDQQEADLKAYLAELQRPGSLSYHKYLTPEQFGALYGPADADIATVSTWLQGHGLAVAKVNKSRTVVEFGGSVAQIDDAFHTSIHRYLVNGEQHYANASDPQIPAALAPVVRGVAHMNNFNAKSQAVPGPRGVYDRTDHRFKPLLTGTSSSGNELYVGPADAATIYDSPMSGLNKNFTGSSSYNGTGVTIGVVGEGNIDPAGVTAYRSFFGLPASSPTIIVDGDDPGIGDIYDSASGEALLDVEISGGIAPGANVNLYVSAGSALQEGLDFAILRALDDNAVDILNISFGQCEAFLGDSGNSLAYNEAEQAAAQGIAVTVSTGDSGSAGCDNPNTETVAQSGLQVSGLASTPYNIAVGGTDFPVLLDSFTTYVSTSNTTPYLGTALGFIPETPWNNSTNVNGALSANVPFKDTHSNTNIVGAGGGASSCESSSTDSLGNINCLGGYAKPSWQKIFDNGDQVRDVPDVSLFASNGFDHAGWAVCATGTEAGQTVNDCQVNSSGQISSVTEFGGTSTAAPAFAGVLAIVQSKVGSRLGQANQVLYPLAKQTPAIFHDVTKGNNAVVCTGGAAEDCASNGFLTGYDAVAGYDLASGLGSVDITALVNGWSSIAFAPSTTALTINGLATPLTVTHGTAVTVGITVTSASGTPTGDVSVLDNLSATTNPNNEVITAVTLDSTGKGSATGVYLPGGTYSAVAHYAGDGTKAASTSAPVSVIVTPESSALALQPVVYDATSGNAIAAGAIPYGAYLVLDAVPGNTAGTADGNATGSVTFNSGSAIAGVVKNVNSGGFAELQSSTLAPGNNAIAAAYSGDASFNASTGTVTIAVAQGVTETSLTATSTTTTASNALPGNMPTGSRWYVVGSTALACVVFFGIPARRRAWKGMLTLIVLGTVMTLTNGCGGGGSSSGGGGGGGGGTKTTTISASVVIATDSVGAFPTGTVTFKTGTTTLGTATVAGSFDATLGFNGLDKGTASATLTSTSLPSGSNTITASYSGDTNYAASTSAGISITVPAAVTPTAR